MVTVTASQPDSIGNVTVVIGEGPDSDRTILAEYVVREDNIDAVLEEDEGAKRGAKIGERHWMLVDL